MSMETMRGPEQGADLLKERTDRMVDAKNFVEGADDGTKAAIGFKLDAKLGGGDDVGKFTADQLKDGETIKASVAELSAYLDSPAGQKRVDNPDAAKAVLAKYLPKIQENVDFGSDTKAAKLAQAMEAELAKTVTMKVFDASGKQVGTAPFDFANAKSADVNEATTAETAKIADDRKAARQRAFAEAGGDAALREQSEAGSNYNKAVKDGQTLLQALVGGNVAANYPDYLSVLQALTSRTERDGHGNVTRHGLRDAHPQYAAQIDAAVAGLQSASARMNAANAAAAKASKAAQ